MPTRRTVLNAAMATVGSGTVTAAALTPLLRRTEERAAPATALAAAAPPVEKFQLPMPVPPVLTPYSRHGGTDHYRITMRPARAEILPGVMTDVLTYDGH
ncbi:hypothetical protein [Streptomyces sp. AC627_RSS907]|uniref:hypothetical protein n=1 Tax=Streptomyces sp. AC627_RSS907 TaxID=2823684 RepID=UPI001C23EDE9|nr:hypothetical protein [Streptomyces sp. AC627_RSS907]